MREHWIEQKQPLAGIPRASVTRALRVAAEAAIDLPAGAHACKMEERLRGVLHGHELAQFLQELRHALALARAEAFLLASPASHALP